MLANTRADAPFLVQQIAPASPVWVGESTFRSITRLLTASRAESTI